MACDCFFTHVRRLEEKKDPGSKEASKEENLLARSCGPISSPEFVWCSSRSAALFRHGYVYAEGGVGDGGWCCWLVLCLIRSTGALVFGFVSCILSFVQHVMIQ